MSVSASRPVRVFARHPMFAASVILSLGVGISAAAGIFAVVESARFGRLPFANADRIEHLFLVQQARPSEKNWEVPAPVFRALSGPDSPVQVLAAYQLTSMRIRIGERSATAWGHVVSNNLPGVLGARAGVGRLFDDREAAPVIVLSYDYWQSEFGGDSSVVGTTVQVNGQPRSIVGVLTRATGFPEQSALWESGLDVGASSRGVGTLALLRPGVDPASARPRLRTLGTVAASDIGPRNRGMVVGSVGLRDYLEAGRLSSALFVLSIIALLVGLITAVNFASLLLARGIRRRAEIGVRAALGASIGRLARELVEESLLLCAAGGALASLLAPSVVRGLRSVGDSAFPGWLEITLGWRTIAGSIVLAMVIGIVFGLGPALDIAKPALSGFLKGAGGTISDGAGLARIRSRLVAAQVALATGVLVALGAVLGHTLTLSNPDPGFDPSAIVRGAVMDSGSTRADALGQRMARVLYASRQAPGVAGAAFRELNYLKPSAVAGESESGTVEGDGAGFYWVSRVGDGFFDVMRPRLAAGRFPNDDELRRGEPLAVITRVVAQELYGDRPLGRKFWPTGTSGQAFRVVGVVDDIRERPSQAEAPRVVFLPLAVRLAGAGVATGREIWLRYGSYVPTAVASLRARLSAGQLGGVEVAGIESLNVRMQRELAAFHRVAAIVLVIFIVALGLAALGIYGLVAYTAEMRSREFAIREALGATRFHIAGRVLRGAFIQAAAGVVAGAVIATLIVEQLNSYQLKITAAAGTTALAFALVGVTVLFASMGPVVSAWRRDLSATLRSNG